MRWKFIQFSIALPLCWDLGVDTSQLPPTHGLVTPNGRVLVGGIRFRNYTGHYVTNPNNAPRNKGNPSNLPYICPGFFAKKNFAQEVFNVFFSQLCQLRIFDFHDWMRYFLGARQPIGAIKEDEVSNWILWFSFN